MYDTFFGEFQKCEKSMWFLVTLATPGWWSLIIPTRHQVLTMKKNMFDFKKIIYLWLRYIHLQNYLKPLKTFVCLKITYIKSFSALKPLEWATPSFHIQNLKLINICKPGPVSGRSPAAGTTCVITFKAVILFNWSTICYTMASSNRGYALTLLSQRETPAQTRLSK